MRQKKTTTIRSRNEDPEVIANQSYFGHSPQSLTVESDRLLLYIMVTLRIHEKLTLNHVWFISCIQFRKVVMMCPGFFIFYIFLRKNAFMFDLALKSHCLDIVGPQHYLPADPQAQSLADSMHSLTLGDKMLNALLP